MFSLGSYSLLSTQTNHAFLTKPAKYDASIKINKILWAHAFHVSAIKAFVSQSGVDADSKYSVRLHYPIRCDTGCARWWIKCHDKLMRQTCCCNAFPFNCSISRKAKTKQNPRHSAAASSANPACNLQAQLLNFLLILACFKQGMNCLPFSKSILVKEIALQEFSTGWSFVWINLQTLLSNQRKH